MKKKTKKKGKVKNHKISGVIGQYNQRIAEVAELFEVLFKKNLKKALGGHDPLHVGKVFDRTLLETEAKLDPSPKKGKSSDIRLFDSVWDLRFLKTKTLARLKSEHRDYGNNPHSFYDQCCSVIRDILWEAWSLRVGMTLPLEIETRLPLAVIEKLNAVPLPRLMTDFFSHLAFVDTIEDLGLHPKMLNEDLDYLQKKLTLPGSEREKWSKRLQDNAGVSDEQAFLYIDHVVGRFVSDCMDLMVCLAKEDLEGIRLNKMFLRGLLDKN